MISAHRLSSTVSILASCLALFSAPLLSAQFSGHDWETDWEQMPPEQLAFLEDFGDLMDEADYEWIGYFTVDQIFTLGFDAGDSVRLPLPDGSVAVLQLNGHGDSYMWGNGDSGEVDAFHFSYLRTDDCEWLDINVVPLGEFRYLASHTQPAHYLVGAYRGDFPVAIDTPPDGSTPPEPSDPKREGWYAHPDLGYYYDLSPSAWLFHPDHGWLYPVGDLVDDWDAGLWVYSTSGWIWSNATFYPWLWLDAEADWLEFGQVRLDPSQWVAVTDPEVLVGNSYQSLTRRDWAESGEGGWVRVPASLSFYYDEESQTSGFSSWFTGDEGTGYSWIMEDGEMTILLREVQSTLEHFGWNPGTGMVWWLGDKYVKVR